MPKNKKKIEASYLPNLTNSLCLRVARMPRSQDLAILVPRQMTLTDDDRQNKPIALPLAHARRVIILWEANN